MRLHFGGHALVGDARERARRLRVEVHSLHGALGLHRRDAPVADRGLQLLVDQGLHVLVVQGAAPLERTQVVDYFLRRHGRDQGDQQGRSDVRQRTDRRGVRDPVLQDDGRLLLGRLRPGQALERGQRAVLGRLLVEEDGLGARARLEAQAGVQVLDVVAGAQRRPVELARVGPAGAQVMRDGAPEDTRCLTDHALGVIEDARHLEGRQALQQHPAGLTELGVVAGEQVGHEEHLVVAHLSRLHVPQSQAAVEERVALQRLRVQRRQLVELAVRRGQEGVEDADAHIALGHRGGRGGHGGHGRHRLVGARVSRWTTCAS